MAPDSWISLQNKSQMEITADSFIFSDDSNLIDVKAVHSYLSTQSYWA